MKHPLLIAGLFVCLVVCGVDEPQEISPSPHTVSYTFDWQSEDAVIGDGSITLQTDLGYEVVITSAYAIAYTVLMVECPDEEEPVDVPGMGQWLWELVTPRAAWAGHSYGNGNDAAIGVPHTEDIMEQEPVELGRITVNPGSYCQFFYLVGRADSVTVGLPEELDLSGLSIYLAGTYRSPEGEPQDFEIYTTRAYALISDLYAPGDYAQSEKAFELDTGTQGAAVTVTRNLDRLFDGVDFETMNTDQQATRVLTQLIDHAELSVTLTP